MPTEETFTQFITDFGEYSWVILFVESDFDVVREGYIRTTSNSDHGLVSVATNRPHELSPSGAVVELKDSQWTVIFHLVGTWNAFDSSAFSRQLNARVIEYSAEDTSGSSSCELYTPSGDHRRYQESSNAEDEAELYEEMNEYAEEMGLDEIAPKDVEVVESYENLLRSFGISVVKISFADDYNVAVVDPADVALVGRVVSVRPQNGG